MLKLSSDTKITGGGLGLLIKLNGLLRGWTFSGIFSKPRLIVGFDPVTSSYSRPPQYAEWPAGSEDKRGSPERESEMV